jgi:poly(3-hydroxybutyrate) depolymerase
MPDVLTTWIADLAAELGVDPAHVDATLLLDVARDAAHGIARPAAPLTTFLVGYAAGLSGGGRDAVGSAAAVAQRLAAAQGPEDGPSTG